LGWYDLPALLPLNHWVIQTSRMVSLIILFFYRNIISLLISF
jgi:hypothetical protein